MIFNNATELANLLGVSNSTITRWVSQGMPCKRGDSLKSDSFSLADVLEWLLQKSPRHERFVQNLVKKWEAKKNGR